MERIITEMCLCRPGMWEIFDVYSEYWKSKEEKDF